jgi:hypothetical protein
MDTQPSNNRKLSKWLAGILIAGITGTLVWLFFADNQEKPGIDPPLGLTMPYVDTYFDADSGTVIHRPSGTHVEIPAGSLVDANGKQVKGRVRARFREFHTGDEIMLSGIPMRVGTDSCMSSNGMVELRVDQQGNQLSLKPSAQVNIDLAATFEPDASYKLFYLEEDEVWGEGSDAFKTVQNTRRDEALAKLIWPKRPKKSETLTAYQFKIQADSSSMPHLYVWRNVLWTVVSETKSNSLSLDQSFRLNWTNVEISPQGSSGLYNIKFTSTQYGYELDSTVMRCSYVVRSNKNNRELQLLQREYAQAVDKYKEIFAAREEQAKRLREENALLNSFVAKDFGIYNIDCVVRLGEIAHVKIKFDFEKRYNPDALDLSIKLISNEQKAVVTYLQNDWKNIPLFTDKCYLFVLLPDGQVAYVDEKQFAAKLDLKNYDPLFTKSLYLNTEIMSIKDFLKKKQLIDEVTPDLATTN